MTNYVFFIDRCSLRDSFDSLWGVGIMQDPQKSGWRKIILQPLYIICPVSLLSLTLLQFTYKVLCILRRGAFPEFIPERKRIASPCSLTQ